MTSVQGNSAAGDDDGGYPVKIGGVYNATPPTYADGQRGDAQLDASGNLKTASVAGETHLGEVGGKTLTIQATLNALAPAIAAAGNYAALDVFSNDATADAGDPFVFAGAARVDGGGGWITRLILTCSATGLLARTRIWFFNAAPTTTEMDDNAAFNITVADRSKVIGYLDLPALADVGDIAYAQNITDRLQFDLPSGTSLYAIGQFIDAETNEAAAMTMTLEISVEQY